MGYWVKVVLWRAQWIEGGARIVETDLDAPGSVVVRHRRVPSDGRDRERDGAIQGTVLALSEVRTDPRRTSFGADVLYRPQACHAVTLLSGDGASLVLLDTYPPKCDMGCWTMIFSPARSFVPGIICKDQRSL